MWSHTWQFYSCCTSYNCPKSLTPHLTNFCILKNLKQIYFKWITIRDSALTLLCLPWERQIPHSICDLSLQRGSHWVLGICQSACHGKHSWVLNSSSFMEFCSLCEHSTEASSSVLQLIAQAAWKYMLYILFIIPSTFLNRHKGFVII